MTQVREINVKTGEETVREYTAEELAAIAAYVPPPAPAAPTRDELLAELAALQAKIEALP
jgi:hypothetical protein